jgi:hypothetical protein
VNNNNNNNNNKNNLMFGSNLKLQSMPFCVSLCCLEEYMWMLMVGFLSDWKNWFEMKFCPKNVDNAAVKISMSQIRPRL